MGKATHLDDRGGRAGGQVGDQVGQAEALPVLEVVLDVVDDPRLGRDVGVVDALDAEIVEDRELDGVPLGLGLGALSMI